MQNQEAIEDLMGSIQQTKPHTQCDFCKSIYVHTDKPICWFTDAANPNTLQISLSGLTTSVGHERVEDCPNMDIVAMVLEIQSLAAGSQ